MAVRNGQQWLSDALDSICKQTFSDFELLVIDDGSTDATPEILTECQARDPRLRVIRQEPIGLIAALNRGLEAARGPLIARLDADDVALPERLQKQVRFLEQHPDVVLLGTWAQVIDESNEVKHRERQPPSDRDALILTLSRTNPFIHSTVMFRTAIARSLGGYRPAFEAAEDYDLWLRLCEIGQIAILPDVLICYREHGGNVTKTSAIQQIFSARLAKLSSLVRRKTGQDPASTMSAPPNWHVAQQDVSYAGIARLCRVLELADPVVARNASPSSIDIDVVSSLLSDSILAERRLAQQALLNLIRDRMRLPRHTRYGLLALFFRLDPMQALRLLWRR